MTLVADWLRQDVVHVSDGLKWELLPDRFRPCSRDLSCGACSAATLAPSGCCSAVYSTVALDKHLKGWHMQVSQAGQSASNLPGQGGDAELDTILEDQQVSPSCSRRHLSHTLSLCSACVSHSG